MDITNNFNKLDTSIQNRIEQEEKYIQDIQSGLVKIIRDLHSCHDSLLDELRDGTLSNEKRDELANLIAATDDRITRFAHAEHIPVADTRTRTRKNPFRRSFWETPRPVPVGVPVTTTYKADPDETHSNKSVDGSNRSMYGKEFPTQNSSDTSELNKSKSENVNENYIGKTYNMDTDTIEHHFGGTRRRRRRTRR